MSWRIPLVRVQGADDCMQHAKRQKYGEICPALRREWFQDSEHFIICRTCLAQLLPGPESGIHALHAGTRRYNLLISYSGVASRSN